ncbi:MAG: CehA/McbA family metallohydrolase [Candidatus Latescibacteria bacterium]|nr:CehA/McbA family metallohydrolase [Candidatus Latescibacterota bacterium]
MKRRQPEIIADAPFRIEPSAQLPILCLIKDANRYPIWLEQVVVDVNYSSGRSQAICFPIGERIESPLWHRVFSIDPLEPGLTAVEVDFWFRDEKGKHIVRNDNYRRTSRAPLVVQIASEPLPRSQGWYYGETHFHSIYTSDQVEFGSPVAAAVQLAQAMGFGWMAVTDHSYDLDDYLGDAVRNSPALSLWEQLRTEVAELNLNTGDFVTLVGEEISCGNSWGRNIHLLGYGIEQFIPGSGDSAKRLLRVSPELSIGEVLARIREQGGVAYAAHPCAATPLSQRFILQRRSWRSADFEEPGLTGLQFWNGVKDLGFHRGRHKWISLLLAGKRIFALAGNDAHGDFNRSRRIRIPFLKIGEADHNCFGKVRTCVLTKGPLSEKSILDALGNGCCILTDGPFVTFRMENEENEKAEIGGNVTGRDFTLQMVAKTNQEFGEFEKIEVFQGIISEREERKIKVFRRPCSRFASIPNLKVEEPCYFRIEARTRKGNLCITNPIWVQPAV